MSKPLPASEKVMMEYLKELLTEDIEQEMRSKVILKPVERLLEQVKPEQDLLEETNTYLENLAKQCRTRGPTVDAEAEAEVKSLARRLVDNEEQKQWKAAGKAYRQGKFQALFFEVAGLHVAVPLIELGGIHNLGPINSLLGKPDWFKGVMLHKEQQFNVIDTAKWVMPEKYNQDLKNSLNYQYIILLNDSPWGLCAERLINTVTLDQDDVKWRDKPGKRPWLAGLVKERMCALIDVDSLIRLLDKGLGVIQD